MNSSPAVTPLRIAIVGLGALGSHICEELVNTRYSPISLISLIDPDVLEPGNLPASPIYQRLAATNQENILGRPKAEVLAEHFSQCAPHVEWHSIVAGIADVGWGQLREHDVIVACTDSVLSRVETAFAARMLCMPMMDAGVFGQEVAGGRVACYAAIRDAACYLCGLSAASRASVLEQLVSPTLSCAALNGIGSMGSSVEGFASVRGTAAMLVRLLLDALNAKASSEWLTGYPEDRPLHLSHSEDCPWHHTPYLVDLADDRPLRDVIPNDVVLLLPWTVALTYRCDSCGSVSELPQRLALLRNGLPCAQCGAVGMQPVRVLERIATDDPAADLLPVQIGLPARHVLPARKRIQSQRAPMIV